MDTGVIKLPTLTVWNPGADPQIENRGTIPEIEVEMDPKAVRQGHDPQLEKAVELVLRELAEHPKPQFKHPPYPHVTDPQK